MRRHSDDELYRIHSRWLGPAGYTLPFSIPLRGILVGAAAGVVGLLVLRGFGASGLPLWLLTTGFVVAASKLVVAVTGPERPVRALAAMFASEVSAPRPADDTDRPETVAPALVPVRQVALRRGREGGRR